MQGASRRGARSTLQKTKKMQRSYIAAAKHAFLWFRNDLRIRDNAIFHHPAVKKADKITPIFCFDPRQFETTAYGSRKTGVFRTRFLQQSVEDLKKSLKDLGGDLCVYYDKPEDVLSKIAGEDSIVICQEEVTSEELNIDKLVSNELSKKRNCKLIKVWGPSLYHPDDLPFAMEALPEPFTVMRNQIERKAQVEIRKEFPKPTKLVGYEEAKGALKEVPSLSDLGFSKEEIDTKADPRGVMEFIGGETAGLKRVKYYTNNHLKTYKKTRNGLVGESYSSKYAPWLANGCISPRTVYWMTRDYEDKNGGQTVDTYWLIFELLWRDFMRFYCVKHENSVFKLEGPKNVRRSWSRDEKLINSWKEGKTGIPWVDANMRELLRTGFMSNRGRQNVASYLVHDLGIDWRFGADHFESLLLDHDVCSNYGNWVAAAGLTGGRINRFNMSKQAKDYDANGAFVKLWCPELKEVDPKFVHHPWLMSSADQQKAGCVIGNDYPKPVKSLRKVFTSSRPSGSSKKYNKKSRNFKGKGRVHRGRDRDFFAA
mmetsp:Transcript_6941/g.10578  ORF Transcript_6941/g.10578 Transcript_6941/m.10578 type:complete len:540 (-) Transcript_6941:153-1772(-)